MIDVNRVVAPACTQEEAAAVEKPDRRPPFSDIIMADREGAPKALEAIEHSMGSIIDKVPCQMASACSSLCCHIARLYS